MNSLADVFSVVNALRSSGVVSDYAIGGALGALFHSEVVRTFDVDVFVTLPPQSGLIVSLAPIYEWCAARGFAAQGEHVLVHGVPVQFLVGDKGLEREAVEAATEADYEGVSVRVMRAEHLVALFARVGDARRRERARTLLDAAPIDRALLADILARYGIAEIETRDEGAS